MDTTRFRFERLDVWKKSIDFANTIYSAIKTFPTDERFGLTSQMRRSAVSISSNIAEGSSRSSDNDFARFIEIAYGSLMECVSQMSIAQAQGYLCNTDYNSLYHSADEVGRMLSSFRSRLKNQQFSGFSLSTFSFPQSCN